MITDHPLVGRKLQALTPRGTSVLIEVTAVERVLAVGFEVYGYRVGTVARRRAETSYPLPYKVPIDWVPEEVR